MKEVAEQLYKYTKFECGECGYTSDYKESVASHLFTVHGISVDV